VDHQPVATGAAPERMAFTLERIGGLLEELSVQLRCSTAVPCSLPTRVPLRDVEEADGDARIV
jgi:hypothetical protein